MPLIFTSAGFQGQITIEDNRASRTNQIMISRRSQNLVLWFALADSLTAGICWLGAYWIRFQSGWFEIESGSPNFGACLHSLPIVMGLALVAYRSTGQYSFDRMRRLREEAIGVFQGNALLLLFAATTLFLLRDGYESRLSLLFFFFLNAGTTFLTRRIGWGLVRFARSRGLDTSFALIVGTGKVARNTARTLRRVTWMGIRPIGFIEDCPNTFCADLDVIGKVSDLPQLIKKYGVGHVFIALPAKRMHEARAVFESLGQSLVDVRLVPDIPGLATLSLRSSNLDGQQVIALRESPHFGVNIVVKRAMDIVLSAMALVILSPVLAAVAIAVKCSSRGPILYRQERCGLNGASFQMLKFRSMRVDAESITGAIWARKGDDRTTRVGKFIRKTSLDELPQFWNVLIGDMSLVGPRPERPVFISRFSKTIPNYMTRHAVKAGITGWAQVHGWRGNTSLRKRLQYDLYYITHWTPVLDIRILWMTIFKGFVHENAY